MTSFIVEYKLKGKSYLEDKYKWKPFKSKKSAEKFVKKLKKYPAHYSNIKIKKNVIR